jgi:hypothetical protein
MHGCMREHPQALWLDSTLTMSTPTTILHLLTRDGAVTATFTPPLNSEQYDRLLAEVDAGDTREKLTELLSSLARSWGCGVVVDG